MVSKQPKKLTQSSELLSVLWQCVRSDIPGLHWENKSVSDGWTCSQPSRDRPSRWVSATAWLHYLKRRGRVRPHFLPTQLILLREAIRLAPCLLGSSNITQSAIYQCPVSSQAVLEKKDGGGSDSRLDPLTPPRTLSSAGAMRLSVCSPCLYYDPDKWVGRRAGWPPKATLADLPLL